MMEAAVKAKTEYTNIRTIASKAMGRTPGQALQAQVHASQAKWRLTQYGTRDEGSNSTGGRRGQGPLCCYGYGRPHPWSVLNNGTYVIKCPNAADPKICDNAKTTINPLRRSPRRITLTIRRRRISPQPILQTLTMKARSELVTKSFNQSQSHLATPLALLLQSLALTIHSLLVWIIFMVEVEDRWYLCTMWVSSPLKPAPHAQFFQLVSRAFYLTSLSSLGLPVTTPMFQWSNSWWTQAQLSILEIKASTLLLQNGTPTALPKTSSPRIIHQSFFQVWLMITHRQLQLICLLPFNFISPTLLVMETQPPLSFQLALKSVWMQSLDYCSLKLSAW